jgi:CelD/BcsL family acetyltransferase involved in cellulose biosynthesis
MIIDLLTDIEPIENLQQEWTSLLNRAKLNNLFLSWEWLNSWCRNMLSNSETLCIITARENQQLMGVAPLVIAGHRILGSNIYFLGQSYSYHLGFISEAGNEERIYNALWDHLFKKVGRKFSKMEFLHLEEDAIFETALKRQADSRGLYIEKSIQNPCKVLKLPQNYEEYLKSGVVSDKLRRNMKYDFHRLKNGYLLDFFYADKNNFEKYWKELLNLHRQFMQNRNRISILMGKSFPDHLYMVAKAFNVEQAARLSVLIINGKTAAIILGINYNGVFNALTIGINPRLRPEMPWLNICIHSLALNIQNAIESGCKEFDFLGGNHDYKYKMGGKDRAGIRIRIYSSKSKMLRGKAILSLKTLIRKTLKIINHIDSQWFFRKVTIHHYEN